MKKVTSKLLVLIMTLTLALGVTGCTFETNVTNNLGKSSLEYNTELIQEKLSTDIDTATFIAQKFDDKGMGKILTHSMAIANGEGSAKFSDGKQTYIINVENGYISTITNEDGMLLQN